MLDMLVADGTLPARAMDLDMAPTAFAETRPELARVRLFRDAQVHGVKPHSDAHLGHKVQIGPTDV